MKRRKTTRKGIDRIEHLGQERVRLMAKRELLLRQVVLVQENLAKNAKATEREKRRRVREVQALIEKAGQAVASEKIANITIEEVVAGADQPVTGSPVTTPTVADGTLVSPASPGASQTPSESGIPDFLRRTKEGEAKDAAAAQEIRDQQKRTKLIKARARIETMLAKKRGDTKKMPLSGKDALAAIRGE